MTGDLAIEARELTNRQGDGTAVDGFDLAVTAGTAVSLLGPTGRQARNGMATFLAAGAPDHHRLLPVGEPGETLAVVIWNTEICQRRARRSYEACRTSAPRRRGT